MARRLDPTIKLQQILRQQLEGALQGDVLTEVRRKTQGKQIEFRERTSMICDGLQVTEQTMPELYALCNEVKEALEFTDEVIFYILGDNEINAHAYISEDADKPHIIIINSGLFNLMDNDEMKFIIGHEIGHLVNKDSYIKRLYNFLYLYINGDEEIDKAPDIIRYRMIQYNQLAEYAADRYGYGACMDLKPCVTALYKLTCGIDLKKMGVSIESLLDQNLDKATYLYNHYIISGGTHPHIPMRIHAMVMYAKCPTLKSLDEQMNMLFESIPGILHSELDHQMAIFAAAAGIKLASKDGKIEKAERDMIVEEIAKYELEPSKLLKAVQKSVDIDEEIERSLTFILEKDPSKVIEMFKYYIDLAFADKSLQVSELESIKVFANRIGLDEDAMYETIADEIRENYNSLAESL